MAIHTELNIPRGPRVRLVLDHLNSALRNIRGNSSGRAGFREDGVFESSLTGDFPVEDDKVTLTWRVTKLRDGTLEAVHVEPADPNDKNTMWEAAAHQLIAEVLAASIAGNLKKFFRRRLYYYVGAQLDGEYWLPGFRFAPAYLDDPQPHLLNAERVVSFDMNVEAIDETHANNMASVVAQRHAARLSLLLNTGLYLHESVQRWVVIHDEEGIPTGETRRCYPANPRQCLQYEEMPAKGEFCQLGKYSGSLDARYRIAGALLSLPPETRRILRGVDALEPRIVDAFDGCARLYQVAAVVGSQFPSVGLAYRVAAVDAIIQGNPEFKTLGDFVKAYAPAHPGLDDLSQLLYGSARSAHFHAGVFCMGEYSDVHLFDPLMDSDMVERSHMQTTGYEVTRKAIVAWLVEAVPGLRMEEEPRGSEN